MPTSDERREVAARLRALPIDTYAVRKEWEEGGLFIDANLGDEADYSQIHDAVFGCLPPEHMHPVDYEELHDRLADLIDPTCHIEDDDWASRQCMGPMLSCDRCGNAFPEINGPYQYCPCCGARVVSDDAQ